MKFIIALLLIAPPMSMANSIYDESVKDAMFGSEIAAIDSIEAYVIGYARASYLNGCYMIGKVDINNFNSRQVADETWLYIKYNANHDESLMVQLMSYTSAIYPCKKEEAN